jgi:hypothetical protein
MKAYSVAKVMVAVLVVLGQVLAAGTLLVQAQGPLPLTETYTSNNGLTFYYPEGWSITEFSEGGMTVITLSSSVEVGAKEFGAELATGEAQVALVISPTTLLYTDLGVPADTSPLELLNLAASDPGYEMGEPFEITLGYQAGARIEGFATAGEAWNDCLMVAVPLDATQMVMGQANFALGEIDLLFSTVFSILELMVVEYDVPEIRQWAADAQASSQYSNTGWNALQATGAPDTVGCGDIRTAWASLSATGQEWLQLQFDQFVIPTQINIYQTYTPGSIVKVAVITEQGEEIVLPNSADSPGSTECPGVFTVYAEQQSPPVNAVIIYLDQSIGNNWNEIDAVELVGYAANISAAEQVDPAGVMSESTMELPELTQTLTFDAENLTVSIPEGWIVKDNGGYVLIKSDPYSASILGLEPGQVEISIEGALGIEPSAMAQLIGFMTPMAETFGLSLGEPRETMFGGSRSAVLETDGNGWHLMAAAMERNDGHYWQVHAYTHQDEFAQYEALIAAILATIDFIP